MRRPMNDTNEIVEIDLQKLFMRYLANWWLIVFCGLFIPASIARTTPSLNLYISSSFVIKVRWI